MRLVLFLLVLACTKPAPKPEKSWYELQLELNRQIDSVIEERGR